MRRDKIEYGELVEKALRNVVREVLGRLVRHEVAEPHHFYITFRTTHSAVGMPDYLRERYPAEMTVVLQHQYWDLEVGDTGFSVTLSFNDKLERLVVPYEAIKVFADPGVEFGLQFTIDTEGQTAETPPTTLPKRPRKPVAVDLSGAGDTATDNDKPDGGAEIVALDRFRKK
ncbi:MAG: hypothetical protein KDE35_03155 [Geminicoccaceae bacterium]|nr:hypothetical protein [Geminicoccaceae bacterium]